MQKGNSFAGNPDASVVAVNFLSTDGEVAT